jgi:hypothetical protein
MRETPKESGRLLQFPGEFEKSIGNLKENSKSSETVKVILLGFQEVFERMIR